MHRPTEGSGNHTSTVSLLVLCKVSATATSINYCVCARALEGSSVRSRFNASRQICVHWDLYLRFSLLAHIRHHTFMKLQCFVQFYDLCSPPQLFSLSIRLTEMASSVWLSSSTGNIHAHSTSRLGIVAPFAKALPSRVHKCTAFPRTKSV